MHLGIRILLQSRQYGGGAANCARSSHGALNSTAVVVVRTALLRDKDACQDRGCTKGGPRPSLVERALLLLDFLEAGAPPLPVRVAHLVGKVCIIPIHGIHNARVPFAYTIDSRAARIICRRQARKPQQTT